MIKLILGWILIVPVLLVLFAFSYGFPPVMVFFEKVRMWIVKGWDWVTGQIRRFLAWVFAWM